MTDFQDVWFLLRHSAFPVASAVFFFLLGLWFAFLLWHRWVHHLHTLKREHRELESRLESLKEEKGAGATDSPPASPIAAAVSALEARNQALDDQA